MEATTSLDESYKAAMVGRQSVCTIQTILSSVKELEGRFTDENESQRGATEHDKRNIE